MNQQFKWAALLFGSIAFIVGLKMVGDGFRRKPIGEYIQVTGMAEVNFESDQIVWSASFSRIDMDMKTAYQQIKSDEKKVREFLIAKGVSLDKVEFGSVNISKEYDYVSSEGNVFRGYRLRQEFSIKSNEMDKISIVSREISELLDQGVELHSENPQYYYTKLANLKMELIGKASSDATARAEILAKKSGSKLGKLKKAHLGVFQITSENGYEEFTWGGAFNTQSRKKTARITVNASYAID